ncbi:unnamed protein product [Polarella glacialis]|uniref:Uncharacterized protein n=1 Tax=Polarella glacialis TaxID=89957 RepID=A0A813EEX0_POLGL|nr:unnamed protein product [Polarella glacialis]
MGAAPTAPPPPNESESESSSRSTSSSDVAARRAEAGQGGRDTKETRKAGAGRAAGDGAGSARSSACESSSSALERGEAGRREAQQPPLLPLLCGSCCGAGLERGSKEYLGSDYSAPRPVSPPAAGDGGAQLLGRRYTDELENKNNNSNDRSKEQAQSRSRKAEAERPTGSRARDEENRPAPLHREEKKLGKQRQQQQQQQQQDDDDGNRSARSALSARSDFSVRAAVVAEHSQGLVLQDAGSVKAALKDFVQALVKGREFHLQSPGGSLQPVLCKLSPGVDLLVVGERTPQVVELKEISHVHRGMEAMPLNLEVQLDVNSVVLEMTSGSCLTFHLGHAKPADDFVFFLRLLTSLQRQQRPRAPVVTTTPLKDDNDDARSECSVQSAAVQRQMNNSPMKSVMDDPKEVKKMFKMFVETMRRGRDFYVVRADGALQDVECALTQGQQEFRMRWDFQNRSIPLTDVATARTSQEAVSLGMGLPVDPRCATLELLSGECITFKFGHSEACDRFILSMRILVDEKRSRFASSDFGGSLAAAQRAAVANQIVPLSARSNQSSASARGPVAASPAGEATKALVESFVRQMLAGCDLGVPIAGGVQPVKCSVNPDLTALQIMAKDGSKKDVPLAKVKAVHVGAAAEKLGVGPADEMCATVELHSGDFLTLRFPSAGGRDRFAVCIRIFASAHQQ